MLAHALTSLLSVLRVLMKVIMNLMNHAVTKTPTAVATGWSLKKPMLMKAEENDTKQVQ